MSSFKCKYNFYDYVRFHKRLYTEFYSFYPQCRHKENYYGECNDKEKCKLKEELK